jgi:hypothetical protein
MDENAIGALTIIESDHQERTGAVGFIDWLGVICLAVHPCQGGPDDRVGRNAPSPRKRRDRVSLLLRESISTDPKSGASIFDVRFPEAVCKQGRQPAAFAAAVVN